MKISIWKNIRVSIQSQGTTELVEYCRLHNPFGIRKKNNNKIWDILRLPDLVNRNEADVHNKSEYISKCLHCLMRTNKKSKLAFIPKPK